MHERKEKGDIGVAKAIASLVSSGIRVALPLSEHLRYDIVGEHDGVFKSIQVRYTTAHDDQLDVKLKSVWSNKAGNHILYRKKSDFDILAIYCPNNDSVYFVGGEEFNNTSGISLFLKDRKKHNQYSPRLAKDYENVLRLFGRVAESGL